MNLLKFLYRDPPKQEYNSKFIKHVIYSNDDEYQGEVLNDKRHGQGTYKFASGNRYEGEWKAHQKHGKGKLYYKNGELYIGDWVENKKQGEGMHFYINGDRYVGDWKDDQKDGVGTIYQADHNIFHGSFRMNKKYGSGYFYNTREKKYYKQHYESDSLIDSIQIEELPSYVQQKFHTKPERHHHEPQQQEDSVIQIDASPSIQNDSDKQKDMQPSPIGSGQAESDHLKQEESKSLLNSLVNSQQHGFLSLQVLEKIEEFENQKNMQEWQIQEVAAWLDSLELGEYKEEFAKNQMTGKTLYGLTDNELKQDLGISVLGHRKKILQSIEEYKKYYVKFMEGRIRLKKPFESGEDRKGQFNSFEQQRFKNIFSYMEKIDEEQPEYHDDHDDQSESSSNSPNSHKKKKNRDAQKSPTRSISDENEENNLSDNISMKIKRQKSKRSKKPRKPTLDLQKSGDSADDEEGKQQLSSPQHSPIKLSNNVSDQKIEILLLNECSNADDLSKEKDSANVTQELSRQQSTNRQDVSDFPCSKSPQQNNGNNDTEIPIEKLPSLAQTCLSRQKSELNGNTKFQDQESSSQESDVSGNDTSSDSSEEEKEKVVKTQKKSRRHKEHKKEKEKDEHQQQHHLPKKLLVMLKEFGINERVLIVFHELIIGQIIGEGGYGVVHKGKWLGQDVAIKSYGKRKSQGKLKYKLQMADFLKEVEVISNLRHPNIVLYMGVCIRKQNYYLITEYLEEGSLFDHLHKKKTHIDQKALMQIVEDIALGMNYLHGRKVMHCDLKSSNVLIDQNWNVKLCDFGLSRINKKIEHKKINARIGTPHWMAPEIMRGEPYQEKADVYSFGMILWETITQQIPYEGLSQTQIIGSVGYGQDQVVIPPCSNPPILLQLAKKCLKKNPDERPNFADIVNEIQMGQKTDAKLKKQAIRQLIDFFE